MDLKNIEAFLMIVQKKSFTAAAEALYITQSTISLRIQRLEHQLNCVLLVRNIGNPISLTQQGKTIYPVLQQAYQLICSVDDLLRIPNRFSNSITISYPVHMADHIFPKLAILKEIFPEINFSLKIDNSSNIIENVRNGWIDSGFVYSESLTDTENSTMFPITEEETVLICSPNHPLLKAVSLSVSDLVEENIIIYHRSLLTSMLVDKYLRRHGLKKYKMIEIQNCNSIKKLVIEGQGISFLQRIIVKEELKNQSLFEMKMKEQLPKTNIYFIARNSIPRHITDVIVQNTKDLF